MENLFVDRNYQLVADCKAGDKKACRELYRLYAKSMLNVAYRLIGTKAEAEDILQESFIMAFRKIKDFRYETTFGLWMKKIVVNRSLSALRKKRLEWIPLEDECNEEIVDEDSVDDTEIQFQVNRIKETIQKLAEGYRVILSLVLLEGYDYEEISGILNITESTARVQFLRAKRKLMDMLSSDFYFKRHFHYNGRNLINRN